MTLLLVVFLFTFLFGGLGFLFPSAWWVALTLLSVWLLGFGNHRNGALWYRW